MSSDLRAQQLFERGAAACRARQIQPALAMFGEALAADAGDPALPNRIAAILTSIGALSPALAVLSSATQRFPDHVESWTNLGALLAQMRRSREAIECCNRVLAIDAASVTAQFNLAKLHFNAGNVEEAIVGYERTLALQPNHPRAYSELLFAIMFDDTITRRQVNERLAAWRAKFAPECSINHPNDRLMNRRLRVGYSSPFRPGHVNTLLIEPILAAHDRNQFELFAYCDWPARNISNPLRNHFDHWRDSAPLNDEQLARAIRNDAIDVLIDLTSHMESGRPGMFARKPAPIQINYLAYPASSGHGAIDYRITCPALDPPGTQDNLEPERLMILPDTFWCYPTALTPSINPIPPSITNGLVTFGCLNGFLKVRPRCLELWSRILARIPNSRLQLLMYNVDDGDAVLQKCASAGIAADRVIPLSPVPRAQHLSRFNEIDVSLDSFPIGGHTTTHDSIWMGVPVVTLAGNSAMSRAGECILPQVQLADLIATDSEKYVNVAVTIAEDVARRKELRAGLRARMHESPLTDAKRFTANLEVGYRAAWLRWCDHHPPADIKASAAT